MKAFKLFIVFGVLFATIATGQAWITDAKFQFNPGGILNMVGNGVNTFVNLLTGRRNEPRYAVVATPAPTPAPRIGRKFNIFDMIGSIPKVISWALPSVHFESNVHCNRHQNVHTNTASDGGNSGGSIHFVIPFFSAKFGFGKHNTGHKPITAPVITPVFTTTMAPVRTVAPATTVAPIPTVAPVRTVAPATTVAQTTTLAPTTTAAPAPTVAAATQAPIATPYNNVDSVQFDENDGTATVDIRAPDCALSFYTRGVMDPNILASIDKIVSKLSDDVFATAVRNALIDSVDNELKSAYESGRYPNPSCRES